MRAWLDPKGWQGFWKGPRRALSALVMCFFALFYTAVALNMGGEWLPAILGLGACYLTAFVALVAPWFWGRWFAAGLSWSGALIGIATLVMMGWSVPTAIFAGLHGAVLLAVAGKSMSADYELQTAWRERFRMDDLGVARLGKTVTRSAASLPSVVIWALGPKTPGEEGFAFGVGALVLFGIVLGFRGLIRLRTWGLLTVATSVVLAGALSFATHGQFCSLWQLFDAPEMVAGWIKMSSTSPIRSFALVFSAVWAAAILLPFGRPLVAHLRRR